VKFLVPLSIPYLYNQQHLTRETPAAADDYSGAWPKLWKEFRHADNINALIYTRPDHEITKSLDENNFDREPFIYWRDYNTTGARYGPEAPKSQRGRLIPDGWALVGFNMRNNHAHRTHDLSDPGSTALLNTCSLAHRHAVPD
jgi:hypothetical protein